MGSKQRWLDIQTIMQKLQNSVFLRHLASAFHLDIVIVQTWFYMSSPTRLIYRLTLQRELWCAVSVPCSPVRLIGNRSVLAYALWLPRLIEGLKVEDVDAPRGDTADGLLPVVLGALETGDSGLVLGSIGGPSYFVLDTLRTTV